jgi:hypothetical protein
MAQKSKPQRPQTDKSNLFICSLTIFLPAQAKKLGTTLKHPFTARPADLLIFKPFSTTLALT